MASLALRKASSHGRRSGPVLGAAVVLTLALAPASAANTAATEPSAPNGPFDTYISIDSVAVDEGDLPGDHEAEVTVTISNYWPPELTSISVLYATWGLGEVDGPTAEEDVDYEESNGLLYFTGLGSKTITVPIIGDTADEGDETFYVKIFGDEIPPWEDVYGTVTIADDDSAPTCQGQAATHWGTANGETINGSGGDDVIVGRGGADVIYAKGGDDIVCAGPGNDVVYAGPGNDEVLGQGGADDIYAAAGADTIWGGAGRDLIKGGLGRDTLYGGLHADTLHGLRGVDTVHGNGGPDALSGGLGTADVCKGGPGTDSHLGGCETMVSIP